MTHTGTTRRFLLSAFSAISIVPGAAVASRETETQAARAFRRKFIAEAIKQQEQQDTAQELEEEKHGHFASLAPPPDLVPFGDWDYYYLKDGPLQWFPNAGETFKPVVVPIGFVTDLASIPRIFWSELRPEGRYAYAAVIHDYLYWTQQRPREEADQILKIAMRDSQVRADTIRVIYSAVRLFGASAWKSDARLRASGEKRILKKFPSDFTVSWSDWKRHPDVFSD